MNGLAAFVLLAVLTPMAANAQGLTLEETVPPGANFDDANFRLWVPDGAEVLQAIVLLVPGSNGDGRAQAEDSVWQSFATKNSLALIGVQLTDKPHEQRFIEEYVDVSRGSGQALLDVIDAFAARSGHAELASAPLLLWGMSAGGEFNYEFVAWKPERVAAFVVNKGGIYYSALLPRLARETPGLLFTGGEDLRSRVATITGLFALNRRAGALWALAEEPNAGHAVGQSRDMAMAFYEDVLALRGGPEMKKLDADQALIGDYETKTYGPMPERLTTEPTAWLVTERVAQAWAAMVNDRTVEKWR